MCIHYWANATTNNSLVSRHKYVQLYIFIYLFSDDHFGVIKYISIMDLCSVLKTYNDTYNSCYMYQ